MTQEVIREVRAPQLGVNDSVATLVEWCAPEGGAIREGALLCQLETTKAALDVPSPCAGRVAILIPAGEEVGVGEVLALVGPNLDVLESEKKRRLSERSAPGSSAPSASRPRATEKARALAARLGVDLDLIPRCGIIREKDVLAHVEGLQPAEPAVTPRGGRILILGGGGHCRTCIELLGLTGQFEIAGIVDEKLPLGSQVSGVPVIGRDVDLGRLYREGVTLMATAVVSLSNPGMRGNIFKRVKSEGFRLPNLVHPSAIVESSAVMGEGNQILARAFVGGGVRMGRDCIVNTGAIVSHDCRVGDHVHIAPGAILAGGVRVGANVLIGMGVTVYVGLKIGEGAVLYNGCHVFKDVPEGAVVKGVYE